METVIRYRGYVVLTLLYAILLGGYILYDRRPQPEPIVIIEPTIAPVPTVAPLQVHVTGAVQQPGVYLLPSDSRLYQAVQAAGGLIEEADDTLVKLADRLSDGQQVYIPFYERAAPPSPTTVTPRSTDQHTAVGANESRSGVVDGILVDINTANLAELDSLEGIGPTYAQRIIDYRETKGPFTDPAQIMNVAGIGQVCYERIKARIVVE